MSSSNSQDWTPAVLITPPTTATTGLQVISPDNTTAVALDTPKPPMSPPLRVTGTFPAVTVTKVRAGDVPGTTLLFDFGVNAAGMVKLALPPGHAIPVGTVLRIAHGEIIQGEDVDVSEMCALCPKCKSCPAARKASKGGSCDARARGALCNTYCTNPALKQPKGRKGANATDPHPLRHEPCYLHQSYTPGFPAGGDQGT